MLISRGGGLRRACNKEFTHRGYATAGTHTHAPHRTAFTRARTQHRRALLAATRVGIQLGYRISPARILGTRPPSRGTTRPDGSPKILRRSTDYTSRDAESIADATRADGRAAKRVTDDDDEIPYDGGGGDDDARNRGTSVTGDDATSVKARRARSGGRGRARKIQGVGESGAGDRPIPTEVTVLT